jgi:uncharacterized protein (TIGR02757 family)
VQIVRRYDRVDDREIVAFLAAGLAFGRVASVLATVEAVVRALGPHPADFVRTFTPARDADALAPIVHRWIRGRDLVAVIWILSRWLRTAGSIERALAGHLGAGDATVERALDGLAASARQVDLRPAYGRVPREPGAYYFFSRPSAGSACKRLNLFLRWMTRRDRVDPGGWTAVRPSQLIVPLDTHTIRVGRCLRLTRRATPGWAMAAEITAALGRVDPGDPVRYDFALCHLSMMGACGFRRRQGARRCPLAPHCRPRASARPSGPR